MPSDRYETGSRRTGRSKQLKDLIEENKSMKVEDIETRSLHAELDYTKKDAVRHIVKSSGQQCGESLRLKLLRNLDAVKKNKPLAQSEIRSTI